MRIEGNGRIDGPRANGAARSSSGATRFSLDFGDGPDETRASRPTAAVGGIDAMLALQSVEDPLTRRRRAVRRGHRLLDALDQLKLDLLEGRAGGEELQRLASMTREEMEAVDDPGLRQVLGEIEVRAAVEVAKRGIR